MPFDYLQKIIFRVFGLLIYVGLPEFLALII